MFLSQKVLEDINHHLEQNPHFFAALSAMSSGNPVSVTGGVHPLFRLLENTRNFSHLDPSEDAPIDAAAGKLYQQLKDFQVKMDVKPVKDPSTGNPFPNLLELNLTISWKDVQQKVHEYTVNHFLTGPGGSTVGSNGTPPPPPFSDIEIGRALWNAVTEDGFPSPPTLNSFLSQNGGDRELVSNLGQLVAAAGIIASTTESFNKEIAAAAAARDKSVSSADPEAQVKALRLQENLASLFEMKAAIDFHSISRIRPALEILAGQTFTKARVGSLLQGNGGALLYSCIVNMTAVGRTELNLKCAESEYGAMLGPRFQNQLPTRRQTPIIRRILDEMKLRALIAEKPDPVMTSIQTSIKDYRAAYSGKIPAFVMFLDREREICADFSSLERFYGGNNGLAGQAAGVRASADLLEEISKRIFDAIGNGDAPPVEVEPTPEPTQLPPPTE